MSNTEPNKVPLREALQAARIPFTNQVFLEPLLDWDDIAYCELRSGYIKVNRKSGKQPLRIHSGYTVGFSSEEEITQLFGDAERWPNKGNWGLTHPENQLREGNETRKSRNARDQKVCPTCFMVLSLSGVCNTCD